MNEIWKDLPEYEGVYRISNIGNLKTIKTGRIKKATMDKYGYLRFCLCKDGIKAYKTAHRLVMFAFSPNEKADELCVNHINGIKDDNRVENLEWVTVQQNNQHAYDNGLKVNKSGEEHYMAKLTWEDITYIRTNYKFRHKEFGGTSLAKKFGVSKQAISNIIHNKSWKEEERPVN